MRIKIRPHLRLHKGACAAPSYGKQEWHQILITSCAFHAFDQASQHEQGNEQLVKQAIAIC
jgi:hypothetical protein